jgi:predicted transport protein
MSSEAESARLRALAEEALGPSLEEVVARQYLGRRAAFRPVFDAVRAAALALGPDVRMEARSSYVQFLRERPFAAVAAGPTHVELGLRLVSVPRGAAPPPPRRLEPATAPGPATHKVTLRQVPDVDGAVRALLRAAYDQNG